MVALSPSLPSSSYSSSSSRSLPLALSLSLSLAALYVSDNPLYRTYIARPGIRLAHHPERLFGPQGAARTRCGRGERDPLTAVTNAVTPRPSGEGASSSSPHSVR